MTENDIRKFCVVCGGNVMMPAAHLARFPVFQGTVATPPGGNELAPIVWLACASCGSAQIETLPPRDVVYQAAHATGIGASWARHHAAFADFIRTEAQGAIVDIGGGSGRLALAYRNAGGLADWTILEPNAVTPPDLPRDVAVAVGFLDAASLRTVAPRTAVLCHVLERLPALQEAVTTLGACKTLTRILLAWPVLERWTARGFAGALNFERCTYITLPTLIALFAAQGWHLHAQAGWAENDTAFLSFTRGVRVPSHAICGSARDTIDLISGYYAHFQIAALQIERTVASHGGEAFMMPAGVDTQTLLMSGLKEKRFRAVLDNAPQKQGARLYGTALEVAAPAQALGAAERPLVVLNAGAHCVEIIRGLKALRDDIEILKVAEGTLGPSPGQPAASG